MKTGCCVRSVASRDFGTARTQQNHRKKNSGPKIEQSPVAQDKARRCQTHTECGLASETGTPPPSRSPEQVPVFVYSSQLSGGGASDVSPHGEETPVLVNRSKCLAVCDGTNLSNILPKADFCLGLGVACLEPITLLMKRSEEGKCKKPSENHTNKHQGFITENHRQTDKCSTAP